MGRGFKSLRAHQCIQPEVSWGKLNQRYPCPGETEEGRSLALCALFFLHHRGVSFAKALFARLPGTRGPNLLGHTTYAVGCTNPEHMLNCNQFQSIQENRNAA